LARPTAPEIIPLGGLGEFGANVTVFRHGRDCVLVDVGLKFPGPEHPGADVIVPDLSDLGELGTLHAVLLTHGHDDHVGALPFLLERHDVPVYAADHALGLARAALADHLRGPVGGELRRLPPDGTPLELGPFVVTTLTAAHSIPQTKMIVVRTPAGTIVHTADYKLEASPGVADTTDLAALEALGREGVLALLGDSTNADRPGTTPAECSAIRALAPLVREAPERVLVTCFASHVERIAGLAGIAVETGRRLALVGGSLVAQVELAERLGLLRIAPGIRVAADEVLGLPRRRVLVVASGSQAEPGSALARIAAGTHRDIELAPGDRMIHAARVIPGNERAISRVLDRLCDAGVDVITAADAPVHVSGHGSRDEIGRVLDLVRPRHLLPIHGGFRQLRAHARLAVERGFPLERVIQAHPGDVISLGPERAEVVARVPVKRLCLDARLRPLDDTLLRERSQMAAGGVVVPIVTVARGASDADGAQVLSRGYPGGPDATPDESILRVVRAALLDAPPTERGDAAALAARIQGDVARFLRRNGERRPLVLPVVLERDPS